MVLNELGNNLTNAFKSLFSSSSLDQQTLDGILRDICKSLLEADVNVKLVQRLRQNIRDSIKLDQLPSGINKKKLVQQAIVEELYKLVDPEQPQWKPKKGSSNVIMFVGLQGAGKTTSCTKLALWWKQRGWRVSLICADTFRAGAFDQTRQNSLKAGIAFYGDAMTKDPIPIVRDGLDKFRSMNYEIIIIDTSGRHREEKELFMEMKEIDSIAHPDCTIMVIDGAMGQIAEGQARAFKDSVSVGGLFITKLDGHGKGGGALSAVAATSTPILFVGTGERVTDIEAFQVKPFISKLLGMGDMTGLMNTLMEKVKPKSDLMKRMEKGEFTLKDLGEQLTMILSMGPIDQIMSMFPAGMRDLLGAGKGNGGGENDGYHKMKKFLVILSSMTEMELNSDGKPFMLQATRINRVAKGSGTTKQDVESLLQHYRKFHQLVKKVGPLSQGGKLQTQKLNSMLTPDSIRRMGGMANIQSMFGGLKGAGSAMGGTKGQGSNRKK